ncbi:MAG: hypothetical protein AAF798_13695 [Bacteroidota bacterium]
MEATLALSIIAIVLSVGWMAFGNLVAGEQTTLKFRANLVLQEVAAETKLAGRYWDETITKTDFLVEQEVQVLEGSSVVVLALVAKRANGQVLANWKEYIYVE